MWSVYVFRMQINSKNRIKTSKGHTIQLVGVHATYIVQYDKKLRMIQIFIHKFDCRAGEWQCAGAIHILLSFNNNKCSYLSWLLLLFCSRTWRYSIFDKTNAGRLALINAFGTILKKQFNGILGSRVCFVYISLYFCILIFQSMNNGFLCVVHFIPLFLAYSNSIVYTFSVLRYDFELFF